MPMPHPACLSILCVFLLAAVPVSGAAPAAPARVILVGDSTMASTTGYGDALCARLSPETACINLARGGRSSGSFRAEGRWDEVRALLHNGAGFGASYVLIQFGHNDQPGKPGRSTDLVTAYPANIARYVHEARALGAVPVLVTPLTRRSFRGAWVQDDLAPWSAVVRQVAASTHTPLIDLHALSMAAVQRMGQEHADSFARSGANFDRTHLGEAGAELFSGMVARRLRELFPSLSSATGDAP